MDLVTFAREHREPIRPRRPQKSFYPTLMEALNESDTERKRKDDNIHRDLGGNQGAPGRDDKETKGGLEWIA